MTTLPDRPNTALLVIDVQNGVVASAHNREGVIANISTLIDKARSADVPVIWVQHSDDELKEGTKNWEYVPELVRGAAEPLVPKNYPDSFEDTELESVLAERKIGRLMVADAHTTEDLTQYGAPSPDLVIAHTNLYWKWHEAPGRKAGTVDTAEVTF